MYERLGGMPFFEKLTARFYEGVASDDVLRPLYPDDLGPAQRHLCLFLAQFWGGPRSYEEERGAPMLRARHLPFKVGARERDAWLAHMSAAVKAAGARPLEEAQLLSYFEATARHMVNSAD
jgi:hemoglobin